MSIINHDFNGAISTFANVLVKCNQSDFNLVCILKSLCKNVRCEKIIDVCTQSCICMWKTVEKSACEVSRLLLSPVVRLSEAADFLAVFPKFAL